MPETAWIPAPLLALARHFDKLYLVGGAVRNRILGLPISDCDIAAPYSEKEVRECLAGTSFRVSTTSPKLGTLKIACEGFQAEYTAFRVDSYPDDGRHAPAEVKFVTNLEEDAFRRDFSINAMYWDLKSHTLIDPTGGEEDCKKRLLRTVRDPLEVFREDGLRLLRLVRFAATYGLEIEENTKLAALSRASLIDEIKPERIREELNGILLADRAGIAGAQRRGVELLTDLKLTHRILPELIGCIGVKQRPDYHRYDVYGHILATLEASKPVLPVRWAALLHDIAKPVMAAETGRMAGHDKRGAAMATAITERLLFSKRDTAVVARLVGAHMFDLTGEAREITVRRFVRNNADILPMIIDLMNADAVGGGMGATEGRSARRLAATECAMRAEGVPFTVAELQVRGEDLIALAIPPERRGEALDAVLDYALENPKGRNRDGQLTFLSNFALRAQK